MGKEIVENKYNLSYFRDFDRIKNVRKSDNSIGYKYSYDAWGRLRNPVNQTPYTPGNEPNLFLGRGYTGHEHIKCFGLWNMNARLYDPVAGRFLSPDPYVQATTNSQNYNRYSYALNNPLKYVDPSGGNFIATEMRHPKYEEGMSTDGWNRALEPPNFWGSSQYSYNWVLGFYVNNNTGNVATWNEVSSWMKSNYYNIYFKSNPETVAVNVPNVEVVQEFRTDSIDITGQIPTQRYCEVLGTVVHGSRVVTNMRISTNDIGNYPNVKVNKIKK